MDTLPNEETKYYSINIDQVAKELETSISNGLSTPEAEKRLLKYGYNEFEKKKHKGFIAKFAEQFKSFMIIVLIIAAAISGVVGYMSGEGFTDAIIILLIVIVNAIIGVLQETKAEKSLDALEKLSQPNCKVVRDGKVSVIPSRILVPGDVVILETGDTVPADLRLVESINLKIEEAALTGESLAKEKTTAPIAVDSQLGDRDNMAFSSCNVVYGRGKGIVTDTGMNTEIGKIASMIQSIPKSETPLQKRLDKLGKFLGIGALVICIIIFVVGVLQGRPILEMFMTAVSLAAAAIPEGLPAVSTIVLAVGVQRLAKRNAIVKNLPSVETLGSTTVICSDKTGTLTQNRMTVVKLYADEKIKSIPETLNEDEKLLLTILVLNNDTKLTNEDGVWRTTGDPTETALVDIALRYGMVKTEIDKMAPRVEEIPFDSERKMMTTINKREWDGKLEACIKGGLDEVLECCNHILINGEVKPLTSKDKTKLIDDNKTMASEALRVIAAAYKNIDELPNNLTSDIINKGFIFAGMVGMIDPPRPEAKAAVEKCRTAGIKPVMITGDHKITAIAIAEELGIKEKKDKALTGAELGKTSDAQLMKEVESVSVYARVAPEHKVRIVKAFQENGEVVAMTGDGVNDAPALKLADIGIAMGITGTDVSKEAADVILVDDNFATIVSAIEEGRRIYDNILKAIQFLLSTNIGEIVVLFVAIMSNWPTPLLPIQILWINLVTDSLPALALSVDPADPDIMKRKPIDSNQSIMNKPFLLRILLQGLMIGSLSLIAFRIGLRTNVEVAQTMTFAVLAFTQITHVLNVRSARHSAFNHMFNNKYLLGALVIVMAMMFAVIEIPSLHSIFHLAPLSTNQWLWVIGLSIAPLPIVELVKGILRLMKK